MEPNLTGVSFKAVLKDNGGEEDEVRRFNVDKEVSTSLAYLQGKLVTLFPRLRRAQYTVSWRDEDGDEVVVGSDEELVIALTEMKGPLYRVSVKVKDGGEKKAFSNEYHGSDNGASNGASNGNARGDLHDGVCCDGCEGEVRGFRYKCAVCPDYDLCGVCESNGVHPGHNMVRIAAPDAAWPHHFFRRLNKMHERAHRRAHSAAAASARAAHSAAHSAGAAAGAAAAAGGEGGDAGTYNPELDPFMNGGFWAHGMQRPGGPGGPRGRMRGRGFGRCGGRGGGGGNKMWEAMMKGWMGEEEMKEKREDQNKENKESAEKKEEHANAKQNNTGASPSAPSTPFDEIMNHLANGGGADYLRNVGNLVAAALDPLGVDVQVDIEHNGRRSSVSSPKTEQANEAKEEETIKEEDKKKEEEAEAAAPKEEDEKRSETPDSDKDSLEGEWTVLDKSNKGGEDKEKEVVNIPVKVVEKEDKKEEEGAVGGVSREVPIEVSDQPAKVLFASPDGTLYPELPKQEAKEEVKGEKEKKPEDEPQPKPSAPPVAPAPAPAPAPGQAEHPDPKIQVALQAMMNMGFSNDGGWLTQLLEAKGGDIGKVLDVLQPVRPVRA